MNIESMRVRSYRSIAVDEQVPAEAAERYRTLKAYEKLRDAGCGEEAALEQVGIARRTLYRWQSAPGAAARLEAEGRQGGDGHAPQVPVHGKARIHAMLSRKGGQLSVSTVGRIIERALAAGAIRHASFCEGRVKPKRRRTFAKWAKRWKYGTRPRGPGEMVQRALARVDHMTYSCGGQTLKEFANRRFARGLSGVQVHGDAGLLARHRGQNAAG